MIIKLWSMTILIVGKLLQLASETFFLRWIKSIFPTTHKRTLEKKVYVFCLVILLIAELVFETIFSCSNELKERPFIVSCSLESSSSHHHLDNWASHEMNADEQRFSHSAVDLNHFPGLACTTKYHIPCTLHDFSWPHHQQWYLLVLLKRIKKQEPQEAPSSLPPLPLRPYWQSPYSVTNCYYFPSSDN